MSKKRIALITTFFPPIKSVATNRMISFVEFLSDEYEVSVFCLGEKKEAKHYNDTTRVFYSPQNKLNTLVKHVTTDNVLVHNLKTVGNIILSKFLKHPLKKWQNGALKDLIKTHKELPFDCIISSHAPPEAHLVAIDFKKIFNTIPWVADMRDEMSLNPGLSEAQKGPLKEIEDQVNNYAQGLTTVSLPILNDFKSICLKVPHFEEIRNGFNHDFRIAKQSTGNKVFKLGYFGTFYGERKPHFLFQAIEELKKEENDLKFEIELYGVHKNFAIPNSLKHHIVINDSLPYTEAIEKMAEMDVNILLLPKLKQKGVYSGKVFDYLSVQRPILAVVDKTDVAAELIDGMKAGYIADFDSVSEIKDAFRTAYSHWDSGEKMVATDEQVTTLHRKYQVEKLKSLIQKILVK